MFGRLRLIFLSFTVLSAVALRPLPVRAQEKLPRFEVAGVYSTYHAPDYLESTQILLGGRLTYNWLPHLAFEGEFDSSLKSPIDASAFEGGYFSQTLFGMKSGIRWKHWGVFAKFRPGFIRYSNALSSQTASTNGFTLTRAPLRDAAFDLGGGVEFFMSHHWLFRYDASSLLVHEGHKSFGINGQTVTLPSFLVKNNFETEVSVAFRF